MKKTGIVRRIDDLGRVVVPKEIRKTLKIREGDPLEIFVDHDKEVILKKYSPINELGNYAREYAEALYESTGFIACIADKDTIITVVGTPEKRFKNKPINQAVEKTMENRNSILIDNPKEHPYYKDVDKEEIYFSAEAIAPIISQGTVEGAVLLGTLNNNTAPGKLELQMAEFTAGLLAKHLE